MVIDFDNFHSHIEFFSVFFFSLSYTSTDTKLWFHCLTKLYNLFSILFTSINRLFISLVFSNKFFFFSFLSVLFFLWIILDNLIEFFYPEYVTTNGIVIWYINYSNWTLIVGLPQFSFRSICYVCCARFSRRHCVSVCVCLLKTPQSFVFMCIWTAVWLVVSIYREIYQTPTTRTLVWMKPVKWKKNCRIIRQTANRIPGEEYRKLSQWEMNKTEQKLN